MKIHVKKHHKDFDVIKSKGWGNGYVILDKGSKYDGVHYDDIPVQCHGGLTYSARILDNECFSDIDKEHIGKWMIGFDTLHSFSTPNMDKTYVEKECEHIIDQLKILEATFDNVKK